ncbi:hypothetical protein Dda_9090 [Drechslerella dactyloides]|uniref:Uncharacterized protein n=1 Tax=Drechslerella dactyloides TaxID=74499 RepID=A0AAD6NFE7_DREDA|nr:hypothetical protein Dda_9090 [Drechslerella dactyloides]
MATPISPLIAHSIVACLGRAARKAIRAIAWTTFAAAILALLSRVTLIREALGKGSLPGNIALLPIVRLVAWSIIAKAADYLLSWMSTDTFQILERLEKANEAKLRPRFFFSTSMHLRLTPNQYFFNYPILYVGFSAKFAESVGSVFSVKKSADEVENPAAKTQRQTWFTFFSVDPKHFMSARHGFEEKARNFLRLQGVNDSVYPHIYVVTAPSFVCWSFNPVTYYYIYDEDMELAYTILEVKNTFQESHAYLLPRKGSKTNEKENERYLYTHTFRKDFHISPFNQRTGAYRVDVLDPVQKGRFDMKVSLLEDSGKRRMTVHTKSRGESLDILAATWVDVVRMVFMWALCGFLVVPRTFKECWRIFKSRNTEIYERPEPLSTSKARPASQLEEQCQRVFLQFLRSRVDNYTVPIKVNVMLPRTDVGVEPTVYEFKRQITKGDTADGSALINLDIEISSHIFWSKALSKVTISELRESELAELQAEMRSVRVSDWDLLTDILDTHKGSGEPMESTARMSLFFGLRTFWGQRMFIVTPILFQWLHGGALETSPIYLYYRLESPSLYDRSRQTQIPLQNFGSYRSAMGGVTGQMLKSASYHAALSTLKRLGCDLEWLPTQ